MANPRQSVDEFGKQYRERAPAAPVREAADEQEAVQSVASPIRQQLQAQFGRTEVDVAISGEDQSPFSTFILAEWAMGTAGLGSLTEASPEAGAQVHGLLQSPEWGEASAGIISRYETSSEPTHAHLAIELIRRSRGQRLPTDVAARLSAALGVDISDAVIHTDSAAAQAAQSVNAYAFATGRDVFFAAGQYKPGTREGDELLLHELTHVVQHEEGRIPGAMGGQGLRVSSPSDSHEREAVTMAKEGLSRLYNEDIGDISGHDELMAEGGADLESSVSSNDQMDGMVHRSETGQSEEAPIDAPREGIFMEGNPVDGALLGHIDALMTVVQGNDVYVVTVNNEYIRTGGYSWHAVMLASIAGMAKMFFRPSINAGIFTELSELDMADICALLESQFTIGDLQRFGDPQYPLPEYTRDTIRLTFGREILQGVSDNWSHEWELTEAGQSFEEGFQRMNIMEQLLLICSYNQAQLTELIDVERAQENGLSPGRLFGTLGNAGQRDQYSTVMDRIPQGVVGRLKERINLRFADRMGDSETPLWVEQDDWAYLASPEEWAEIILEVVLISRAAVEAANQRYLQDASDEERAQAMRPRRLDFIGMAMFLIENFNSEARVVVDFGLAGQSELRAGDAITNGQGHTLRVLDYVGGCVIYHNESDMMFYSQSWAGFNVDVTLGAVAGQVAERAAGVEAMADGALYFLAWAIPPARVLLLSDLFAAAASVAVHAEQVEQGVTNFYRSYRWIDEEFPGLMRAILVGAGEAAGLAVEHVDVFEVGVGMRTKAWLKLVGKTFAKAAFGGKFSAIGTLLGAVVASLRLQIDMEAAQDVARAELEEALRSIGIQDVAHWAAEILSRPLDTYRRLITELRMAGHAASDVAEVLDGSVRFE